MSISIRAILIVLGVLVVLYSAILWLAADQASDTTLRAGFNRSARRWFLGGALMLALGLAWPLFQGD